MGDAPDLLEERFAAIDARLQQLEEQVAALNARLDQLAVLADNNASLPAGSLQPPASAEPPLEGMEFTAQPAISPGMLEVIGLIHRGKGDEAQRRLQALPSEELEEQPAVVAIAAAALCTQRDDYASALRALKRARELTDDPRMLKVIQLVEAQVN